MVSEGQVWQRDGERIRIIRVSERPSGRRSVQARALDGQPVFFSAPELPAGDFLADPEWIENRYRLVD